MATVSVLVVGGGGGGGTSGNADIGGGGGGAGDVIADTTHTVTAQAYSVTVGTGGAVHANGGNSVFDTITSLGGGRGGGSGNTEAGAAGGSGGGGEAAAGGGHSGTNVHNGGTGSSSGSTTDAGGGGGGANAAGSNGTADGAGGAGGAGIASSVSGASVTYGGGGGGADGGFGTSGNGGSGGGGKGAQSATPGVKGTDGLGGGGGGGNGTVVAGAGGNGVVIISYVTGGGVSATGGTITTSGGNTIHTFTTSGTFTVSLITTTSALSATQGQTATLSTSKLFVQSLTATQGQTATLAHVGIVLPNSFRLYRAAERYPYRKWTPPNNIAEFYVPYTPIITGSPASWVVTLNGVIYNAYIRAESIRVEDILNEAPNLASFTINNLAGTALPNPTTGMEVIIGMSNTEPTNRVFAGNITTVTQVYDEKRANVAWHVECQDYTYLLNRRRPLKQYTGVVAETIVKDLIATYTSGFTSANVATGFAALTISFDGSQDLAECLTQLANLAGAYWYPDYARDIHFFINESSVGGGFEPEAFDEGGFDVFEGSIVDPDPINENNAADYDGARLLVSGRDLSQIRTRVTVIGKGSSCPVAMTANQFGRIPLDDATPFNASGGYVFSGAQVFAYTGRSTDSAATKGTQSAGVNQSPGAPTATLVSVGSIGGTVYYKVSFVMNGAANKTRGESELGSASAAVLCTQVTAPYVITVGAADHAGDMTHGGTYYYVITFVSGVVNFNGISTSGETDTAGYVSFVTPSGGLTLSGIPVSGDSRVVARRIYRSRAGQASGPFYLVGSISDNTTTTFLDTTADAALGSQSPSYNTTGDQTALTGVPTGDVTYCSARKIWRTRIGASSGSTYYLVGTIPDNSTTTFSDNVPDASVSTPAPTESQVSTLAGSTIVPVEDCSQLNAFGGWLQVGSQVISYQGRSASSGRGNATTVPASGTGSLTSDVTFNTTVSPLPHIEGVTGMSYALQAGDVISLWVQRDNVAAQVALSSLEGGDGIHEYQISDSTIPSDAAAITRGDAELSLFKSALLSLGYQTRDINTRSGRYVIVNLLSPTSLSMTILIQQVTITGFEQVGNYPVRTVKATSAKFTLQDLLRRVALSDQRVSSNV